MLGHLAHADELFLLASSPSELKEKLALFKEKVLEAGMKIFIPEMETIVVSSEANKQTHWH